MEEKPLRLLSELRSPQHRPAMAAFVLVAVACAVVIATIIRFGPAGGLVPPIPSLLADLTFDLVTEPEPPARVVRAGAAIEPEDAESAPSPSAEPTTSLPSVAPPALSAQGQGAGTDRSPGQAKGKGPGKGKGKGKGSGGTKGDGGGSPGGHGATAPGGGQGNGKAKGHGKAKGQSSSPSSGKTTSPGKTKGPGKAKGPTKSNGPGKSKSPGKSKGHGKAKGHSRH